MSCESDTFEVLNTGVKFHSTENCYKWVKAFFDNWSRNKRVSRDLLWYPNGFFSFTLITPNVQQCNPVNTETQYLSFNKATCLRQTRRDGSEKRKDGTFKAKLHRMRGSKTKGASEVEKGNAFIYFCLFPLFSPLRSLTQKNTSVPVGLRTFLCATAIASFRR